MTDWLDIAGRFNALEPSRWLDAQALEFLARLEPQQRVMIACSGGADSVFLTLTAYALLGPGRLRIAHYHHGLRGSEADEDAAFVEQLSQALGIGVSLGRRETAAGASEATLRIDRYGWLMSRYLAEQAGALLLGHHADDLLETQLMSLLSGSGPAGMCAPLPVHAFSDGHVRVRPLISVKRAFIEETLQSLEAPWREDRSNQDTRFTRNWVRRELVPRLVERFPQDIHAGSARTCKLQREVVNAMDAVVGELQVDLSDDQGFDGKRLKGSPTAIIRRILYAWWMRHFGDAVLPTKAADKVVECLERGQHDCKVSIGSMAINGGQVQSIMIRRDGKLRLIPESEGGADDPWRAACRWHWQSGPVFLPAGARLSGEAVCWAAGQAPYRDADPGREAWLSLQTGPLRVRQWQHGDRYRPLGAPGTRKLQDIFCDAKLNSEQKQALPVILDSEGEILWVPGFPPADSAQLMADDKSALRLTYRMHSTAF